MVTMWPSVTGIATFLTLLIVSKCCENVSPTLCCTKTVLARCGLKCQAHVRIHCPKLYKDNLAYKIQTSVRRAPIPKTSQVIAPSQRYKRSEMCGTRTSHFIPCVERWRANGNFLTCCKKFVDSECHDLCRYETDEQKAHSRLEKANKKGCSLTNLSPIFYCASQHRDNTDCCLHMGLHDKHCLRFCNPTTEKVTIVTEKDSFCLRNLAVLMYCHFSGLT